MADLAALLTKHRVLIIDALARESARRQKVATAASLDTTNDPMAIVQILGDAAILNQVRIALADTGPVESAPELPVTGTMNAKDVQRLAVKTSEEAVKTNDEGVRNILDQVLPQATVAPPVDDDEQEPIHAFVLAPDAIALLIGDDADPMPEDASSPSAQNSAAHGDAFGDFPSTAG